MYHGGALLFRKMRAVVRIWPPHNPRFPADQVLPGIRLTGPQYLASVGSFSLFEIGFTQNVVAFCPFKLPCSRHGIRDFLDLCRPHGLCSSYIWLMGDNPCLKRSSTQAKIFH